MNKIMVMLAAALCVFGAQAEDSYMYWMIDDYLTLDGAKLDVGSGSSYSAKVAAYSGDPSISSPEYMTLAFAANDGSMSTVGQSVYFGSDGIAFYSALATNLTGDDWNYYVEIWSNESGQNNLVGRSEGYTTDQAADYIRSSSLTPGIFATVSSFSSPVPEPTSGLLMLIGTAALALRRRKIRV